MEKAGTSATRAGSHVHPADPGRATEVQARGLPADDA